jgi:hypothetical protein
LPYPWTYEENFESGSNLGATIHNNGLMADAISPDPFTRAGIDHYTTLARRSDVKTSPYRGAYCFRIDLAPSTTAHYIQETGTLDMADTDGAAVRFALWLSPDLVMADTNEFAVFQLWSGASTVEGGVYINFTTADGFRIGIGETSASSFLDLTLGVWHIIEVQFVNGTAAGTIDGFLDGSAFTQVTGLAQGAITSAVFGVMGQDAGTTRGVVLIDEIVGDTAAGAAVARIGPIITRFPQQMLITRSQHVCMGNSKIQVQLLSGSGTADVLQVYDTDTAYVLDTTNVVKVLNNTAANQVVPETMEDPDNIEVQRGAFIDLNGTSPRALVRIHSSQAYWSDGRIRQHASNRKPTPIIQ